MKEEKAKKGFTPLKAVLLGVFVAILAVVGGAFGSLITSGNAAEISQLFSKEEEEEPEVRLTVSYEEFLINLKPVTERDKSYLRIELAFSVASEESQTLLTEQEALVRDVIITTLRSQNRDTVFAETDGNLNLKTSLMSALNETLGGDIIKDIYVTNMVMQ